MHMTPLGEDSWTLSPDLSWTLPFADLNLHLFIVINHNHEDSRFLSSVSPSSKSLNLRVVLGTLSIVPSPSPVVRIKWE